MQLPYHTTRCMKGFHSLDGAAETLVLLWIVVLESDLQFHGFEEVAFLIRRLGQQLVDAFVENVFRNFRPGTREIDEKSFDLNGDVRSSWILTQPCGQ